MSKILTLIKKHKSFIINAIIPMIIFLILFMSYYPGIITYDGNNQWQQVQSGIITNAHPFFSTYFMYLLSKLHNTTSTVLLFQMIIFSFIWGILCDNLKCSRKLEIVKICFTTIMCLTPIIGIYSITLWKDILYSYYLFALSIILFKGINNDFKYSIFDYLLFGLLLALVFSYRHNGMIVSVLFLIIILFIVFKKRKQMIKKELKKSLTIILSFIIVIAIIAIPKKIILESSQEKITKQTSQKKEISLSTIDSYTLWIMGAHITDGNISSSSDLEFLNNIIPIKEWKDVYDPYIINSTNLAENLDKEFLVNNSNKFRNIFIKYSKKNPGTIISHYLKSDALLINPISSRYGYVYIFSFSEWSSPLGFEAITNSKLPIVKKYYNKIINYSISKPLDLLYQPALWLYFSIIFSLILSIKVYGKKIWLFIMPMILNTISLLPINLAQDLRYVYINFLTFFGILIIFIVNYKSIITKKKKA